MVEDVEMEVTPLVKALTRTPTLFGVPYMYSMFNMVVTAVVFLLTKNLLSGFLVFPIHALGYVLTLRDDKIFNIIRVKAAKCPPRSKAVWGVNSYRP
jgi:type IV secretion system protein VirB3